EHVGQRRGRLERERRVRRVAETPLGARRIEDEPRGIGIPAPTAQTVAHGGGVAVTLAEDERAVRAQPEGCIDAGTVATGKLAGVEAGEDVRQRRRRACRSAE